MYAMAEADTLDLVDEGMGDRVRARRVALGISAKALAMRAGVDRGRLAALEAGDPSVTERTVGAIDRALGALEREMGIEPDDKLADVIEFRVAGNFGVDVVVKGPVRDMAAIEDSVARLITKMQAQKDESAPSD